MYCSVHARAVARRSDPPKIRKDAYTEALRLVDERRQHRQRALQEEKKAREWEEKKDHERLLLRSRLPLDQAECYVWYEPDESDADDSHPRQIPKKKGRFLCLLCNCKAAEMTHVESKKHKAQVALYTNYLKRERIASTEKAVYDFAAAAADSDDKDTKDSLATIMHGSLLVGYHTSKWQQRGLILRLNDMDSSH